MRELLTNVCRIQYGYAFDSSLFSDNQGLPLVRIRDVVRGFSETYTTEKCSEEYIVHNGDMLIGMDGEFNIAKWNGGEALLNQRVCKLLPTERINAGYLYYFMPSALKAIETKTPFVTVKHLSAKELNKIEVPLPPMEEQKETAKLLGSVSAIIEAHKQQLAKLDELVKSRFVEMFGNRGENPFGFPTIAMGNVYKFQYGKGNNIPEDKGDYPCYGSNGIVGHHTEYNSEDSPIIGHIGAYAGIVNWGKGKHYVTYNGVICKLINDQVNPVYGYYLLQIQDYNAVAKSGAAQPFVSYKDLDAPVANIPPLELQNRFAAFVEQTDKSKLAVKQSLEKLETLKKSLMQKYFG